MSECVGCRPDLLPDDRVGEHHVGVRFGDAAPGWLILLDGEDVTDQTWEALAGPNGWVVFFVLDAEGKRQLHKRGGIAHLWAEQRHGDVQVIRSSVRA